MLFGRLKCSNQQDFIVCIRYWFYIGFSERFYYESIIVRRRRRKKGNYQKSFNQMLQKYDHIYFAITVSPFQRDCFEEFLSNFVDNFYQLANHF